MNTDNELAAAPAIDTSAITLTAYEYSEIPAGTTHLILAAACTLARWMRPGERVADWCTSAEHAAECVAEWNEQGIAGAPFRVVAVSDVRIAKTAEQITAERLAFWRASGTLLRSPRGPEAQSAEVSS